MAAGTVRTMQDQRRTKHLKRGSPTKMRFLSLPFRRTLRTSERTKWATCSGNFSKLCKISHCDVMQVTAVYRPRVAAAGAKPFERRTTQNSQCHNKLATD